MTKPENSVLKQAERGWSLLFNLLFAVWWGGLTFYALFVVPIGSHEIGAVGQGFITQQVTWWHNILLSAMSVCLIVEAWRANRRWLWLVAACLILVNAALLFEHARLTALLDFTLRTAPQSFYARHAIYLWLTALEWGLGVAILLLTQISRQPRK